MKCIFLIMGGLEVMKQFWLIILTPPVDESNCFLLLHMKIEDFGYQIMIE